VVATHGLSLVGPDSYESRAVLFCGSEATVGDFSDMNACVAETDRRADELNQHCGCRRPRNQWALVYSFFVVPLAFVAVSWFALAGAPLLKLALANLAILGGAVGMWGLQRSRGLADAEALPAWVLYVAALMTAVSLLLSSIPPVLHLLKKRRTR
jgi:hypothetical protein